MIENMTKEDLIAAIREACDLRELRQLVGPSDEMNAKAKNRLDKLDHLDRACQWGEMFPDWKALEAREKWTKIMNEQTLFENEYC